VIHCPFEIGPDARPESNRHVKKTAGIFKTKVPRTLAKFQKKGGMRGTELNLSGLFFIRGVLIYVSLKKGGFYHGA
jgi:hypothetical protein